MAKLCKPNPNPNPNPDPDPNSDPDPDPDPNPDPNPNPNPSPNPTPNQVRKILEDEQTFKTVVQLGLPLGTLQMPPNLQAPLTLILTLTHPAGAKRAARDGPR